MKRFLGAVVLGLWLGALMSWIAWVSIYGFWGTVVCEVLFLLPPTAFLAAMFVVADEDLL